jgi:hypothetical protein
VLAASKTTTAFATRQADGACCESRRPECQHNRFTVWGRNEEHGIKKDPLQKKKKSKVKACSL